jgi:enamine deaminase RidA (YjgF/YER057c/UK114 family)
LKSLSGDRLTLRCRGRCAIKPRSAPDLERSAARAKKVDGRVCCGAANMAERRSVSTGSPYEPIVGIARAVRIGNLVAVAGTAHLGPDGKTVGPGDPKAQARRCFEISRVALEQLGAGLQDVIRTRILLTRIQDWKAVAEVHGEFFRDIRPVNTILQVSSFIDPDWLIETEVDAVLTEG